MRFARAVAAVAAALVVAFAVAPVVRAHAEEAGDDAAPKRLVLRALDHSAMLETMRRPEDTPPDVPLGGRRIHVLVTRKAGGAPATPAPVTSDDAGRFEVPLDGISAGDSLSFRIDADAAGRPLYASMGIDPFAEPPAEIAHFYRVARGESPLEFQQLQLTVRKVANDDGSQPYVRINVIAAVANMSPEVWLGGERGAALELPLPEGFEVITVHRDGVDHRDFRVGEAHGGRPALQVGGIFLPAIRGPEQVRVIMTGPWRDEPYDLAFHTESPIDRFQLNLEDGVFSYVEGGEREVALQDAGVNPPIMGVVSHGWAAEGIPPHATINSRFRVGRAVHPRVKLVVGALGLVVLGGVLLGVSFARRRADDATREAAPAPRAASGAASGPPPVAAPADAAAQIRDLERRRERGEITSFEFAARKALLEGRAPHPSPARPAARTAPAAADDPARALEEIEARADRADEAQLRRDVKTLAALLRRRLRG